MTNHITMGRDHGCISILVFLDLSAAFDTVDQGSSTFFSPRTPWLSETLSRDPPPRHPKFRPDIHIFYLELSVSHTHTHKHTPLHMFEQNYKSSVTHNSFQFILFIIDIFSPLQLAITLY